jgi:hypothetical protein
MVSWSEEPWLGMWSKFVDINGHIGILYDAKDTGFEVVELSTGYPVHKTYPVDHTMQPASRERILSYLDALVQGFDQQAQQGDFAGAIAARRKYNIAKVRDTVHSLGRGRLTELFDTFSFAEVFKAPPLAGTGVYVLKGQYFDDENNLGPGHMVDVPNFEAVSAPASTSEEFLTTIVDTLCRPGIGRITFSAQNGLLIGYDVYEVPPDALSFVQPRYHLNLSLEQKQ